MFPPSLALPPPPPPKIKTTNHLLDGSQAGYREGITAGKEGALQEGFDAGFAQTGAPLGRELGLLRGLANALHLHLHLSRPPTQNKNKEPHHAEPEPSANVREIVDALAAVRFADIAPPLEEEHTHTHCAEDEIGEKKKHEHGGGGGLEGGEETSGSAVTVTAIEDVRALRVKLETLLRESGLKVDLNLETF